MSVNPTHLIYLNGPVEIDGEEYQAERITGSQLTTVDNDDVLSRIGAEMVLALQIGDTEALIPRPSIQFMVDLEEVELSAFEERD
jgi:hypothetical protein